MRKNRQQLFYRPILSNLLLLLLACACDNTIKTDEAEVGEPMEKATPITFSDTFLVDTAKSEIAWIGSKITGKHNGIFRLQSGDMQLLNDELTGGTFVIDMTSLKATDKTIGEESNRKLTTHLQSPDFFDVGLYPIAVFDFVSVAPYDSTGKVATKQGRTTYSDLKIKNPTHTITGNLTIKGKVKCITFPARVTIKEKELKAKANFNIDRTEWGLTYRSDESLGDKTINKTVNLGFDIVARPEAETSQEEE